MKTDKGPDWKDIYQNNVSTFKKTLFWLLIVILAALTIRDVQKLLFEYFSYPTQSDMTIMFNESMTMPNITFCMSKDQAWSHFKINESEDATNWDSIVDSQLANMTDKAKFMKTPWDYRLVMEAYDTITSLSSLERETDAHGAVRSIYRFKNNPRMAGKRKTVKKWLKAIDDRNITVDELMQKAGKEALRRSMQRWQRLVKDEDVVIRTGMHISWISQQQMCFQPEFDSENYPMIKHQGPFFTMLLAHNWENLGSKLECMSVDFHGRPSSLNRFMEKGGSARDGFTFELCAGMRHEVTVEVRAQYKMVSKDDDTMRCKETEDGDDTEFECFSKCRMALIRNVCNCTAATISYLVKDDEELKKYPICDYTQCDISAEMVQQQNFSDTECTSKCLRDCTQIRFDLKHDEKGRMVNNGTTLVNLNFGAFEYLKLTQEWKWTITTFIAAVGGAIGVYLGLSVLSVIQASILVYILVWAKTTKSSSTSYTPENQPPPEYEPANSEIPNKTKKSNFGANPFENPYKKSLSQDKLSKKRLTPGQSFDSETSPRHRMTPSQSFDNPQAGGYSANPEPTTVRNGTPAHKNTVIQVE